MPNWRVRLIQAGSTFIVHAIGLVILAWLLPGFMISSVWGLAATAIGYGLAQSLFWWVFVHIIARLPVWLYPLFSMVLSGLSVVILGIVLPGVVIQDLATGLWIVMGITALSAVMGGLLSLDEDAEFDRNVTRPMVARFGTPVRTDVPGILFLEIDGLSEAYLRRALEQKQMPTLRRWLEQGTHRLAGWETEFSSQTGAMQAGILLGHNTAIPAYRWWDREAGKEVISGIPGDAQAIEARLSQGRGLLAEGGSSRGNMFSGDATESMLTFSTLLDRTRANGPGFYFYLLNPYVIARLATRFLLEVGKEWWQSLAQRLRRDPYRVSARNLPYGLLRGVMNVLLQDVTTYMVIGDVLRGVPAAYALYAGYDDLSHFAGMHTPEAFHALNTTDRYFARIEQAVKLAPRPYHIVVLSDHGQSLGGTFKAAHKVSLQDLVQRLLADDHEVGGRLETNEAWDNLSALLNESTGAPARATQMARQTLARGAGREHPEAAPPVGRSEPTKPAKTLVYGSGCAGLIYLSSAPLRQTYEQIVQDHPLLIAGLANHPGIGFVVVKSEQRGLLALGKDGIYYLDTDEVEGRNPLEGYGPNAAAHLRREAGFENCPDLIVNTAYDPQTQELRGFEDQVSHHGGLGGPQNYPFVLYPAHLPGPEAAIVGAEALYQLLRGWRDQLQPKAE